MGREVPRNNRRRNDGQANDQPADYPYKNGGGQGGASYSRRGAPYRVGEGYRYMPEYREERDPYFRQYEQNVRPGGGRGFRGGRDQARPGYFPAARQPRRPDQLVNDFGYENQRRQHYPQGNGGFYGNGRRD